MTFDLKEKNNKDSLPKKLKAHKSGDNILFTWGRDSQE
jgi:hypothetical protein